VLLYFLEPSMKNIEQESETELAIIEKEKPSFNAATSSGTFSSPLSRPSLPFHVLWYIPSMQNVAGLLALSNQLSASTSPLTLIPLRLTRLSERTSTVMMANRDNKKTVTFDPVFGVVRSFGTLHSVQVVPKLVTSSVQGFPKHISSLARRERASLIVLPWGDSIQEGDDDNAGPSEGEAGEMEFVVDGVHKSAGCAVGVFLDRGFGKLSAAGEKPNVVVLFAGGVDDCEAAMFARHLALGSANVTLLRVKASDSMTYGQSGNDETCFEGAKIMVAENGGTVDSIEAQGAVLAVNKVVKNGRDLVVMGAAFYESAQIKSWVNNELSASVLTIQGQPGDMLSIV